MNAKPNQWLQAEENFHFWIEKAEEYPINNHTELRKAIHVYFRRKYHKLFTSIANWVFDNLPLQELLDAEKLKEEEYYKPTVLFDIEEDETKNIDIYFNLKGTSEINKEIFEGFWKDDKQTIYNFYEKEFSKIAWLILKNNGSIEDAKDIFQDVLVILMDKFTWGKLDLNCSLGTYVYSISRNLWMEQLRKRQRETDFIDIKYYDTVEICTDYYHEEPDIYPMVCKAIESLGNPCKELIELYYFENHSWEAIAKILNYSNAASARNQKYKCLERIRKEII